MKKKGLIVISDYYSDISKNLLKYCLITLKQNGLDADVKTILIHKEIPTLISCKVKNKKYKFFIENTYIIKGKTPHFDFISSAIYKFSRSILS